MVPSPQASSKQSWRDWGWVQTRNNWMKWSERWTRMVSVYLRLILVEGYFRTHPQRMGPVWPSVEGLIRENLIYHQLEDDILLRQFKHVVVWQTGWIRIWRSRVRVLFWLVRNFFLRVDLGLTRRSFLEILVVKLFSPPTRGPSQWGGPWAARYFPFVSLFLPNQVKNCLEVDMKIRWIHSVWHNVALHPLLKNPGSASAA